MTVRHAIIYDRASNAMDEYGRMRLTRLNKVSSRLKTVLFMLLLSSVLSSNVYAEQKKVDTEVKELSGISIIGNKEAPKSLYIVPWQNSEVGVETSLNSGLLDDSMAPLDKDVFLRELEFYQLSHDK